jgi:hypothetical protein
MSKLIYLKTIIPRTYWSVVERDGQPELVIWREWLGNAYKIVSLAGSWGRWDRQRIANETKLTPKEER